MLQIIEYTPQYQTMIMDMIREFRDYTASLKNRSTKYTLEKAKEELSDIQQAGYLIYLAVIDKEALGYITCKEEDGVYWVESLFTRASHRRHKIGSALYNAVEKYTQERGADNLFVWVHPNNQTMLQFLQSRGYNVLNLIELRKPWQNEQFTRKYHFEGEELEY